MSSAQESKAPWLVAVWPGMGHVALTAGYYLMAKLGMRQLAEFAPETLFDVDAAIIRKGIVRKPQRPRSRLFIWEAPKGQRDIIVFIGEAQPPVGKYAFCEQLIEYARQHKVERVFTFAAMATEMNPGDEGKVYAAATDESILDELADQPTTVLNDGQVGGMNGILLTAAAEQELPGVCLLGEMPHVFVQMLYPKPSMAVLRIFSRLAGIELDLAELAQQSEATEHHLQQLINRFQRSMEASGEAESPESGEEWKQQNELSERDTEHIESLFAKADEDPSKAYELKAELDRLGIFADYEDRFLDLFKRDQE